MKQTNFSSELRSYTEQEIIILLWTFFNTSRTPLNKNLYNQQILYEYHPSIWASKANPVGLTKTLK